MIHHPRQPAPRTTSRAHRELKPPRAAAAHPVQKLQHEIGNRAFGRLLRDPDTKAPPPQYPIRLFDVKTLINENLDTWYNNSKSSIEKAELAGISESRKWFLIALLGNLTWAATSLLGPEFTFLIRLMSFAGATIGSDTMHQLFGSSSEAALKMLLKDDLNTKRNAMKRSPQLAARITKMVNDRNLTDAQDPSQLVPREDLVWEAMFGKTLLKDDPEAIEKRVIADTEAISVQFDAKFAPLWSLVHVAGVMNKTMNKATIYRARYVRDHFPDLWGRENYEKNWPNYVRGIYFTALTNSGVIDRIPEAKREAQSQFLVTKFSDPDPSTFVPPDPSKPAEPSKTTPRAEILQDWPGTSHATGQDASIDPFIGLEVRVRDDDGRLVTLRNRDNVVARRRR